MSSSGDSDSITAVDTQADSVISDILLLQVAGLHMIEEVSNHATARSNSTAAKPPDDNSDTQGSHIYSGDDEDPWQKESPPLTAHNLACCMHGLEVLPHIAVTARLLSGARVCLAGICQAPSRPLMTWPGNFAVRSALTDTDWVVEVGKPSDKCWYWGAVYTITNGIETTYVRMLDWQPDYITLMNGICVTTETANKELCIGQGAISLVDGQAIVAQTAEVTVLRGISTAGR